MWRINIVLWLKSKDFRVRLPGLEVLLCHLAAV